MDAANQLSSKVISNPFEGHNLRTFLRQSHESTRSLNWGANVQAIASHEYETIKKLASELIHRIYICEQKEYLTHLAETKFSPVNGVLELKIHLLKLRSEIARIAKEVNSKVLKNLLLKYDGINSSAADSIQLGLLYRKFDKYLYKSMMVNDEAANELLFNLIIQTTRELGAPREARIFFAKISEGHKYLQQSGEHIVRSYANHECWEEAFQFLQSTCTRWDTTFQLSQLIKGSITHIGIVNTLNLLKQILEHTPQRVHEEQNCLRCSTLDVIRTLAFYKSEISRKERLLARYALTTEYIPEAREDELRQIFSAIINFPEMLSDPDLFEIFWSISNVMDSFTTPPPLFYVKNMLLDAALDKLLEEKECEKATRLLLQYPPELLADRSKKVTTFRKLP